VGFLQPAISWELSRRAAVHSPKTDPRVTTDAIRAATSTIAGLRTNASTPRWKLKPVRASISDGAHMVRRSARCCSSPSARAAAGVDNTATMAS